MASSNFKVFAESASGTNIVSDNAYSVDTQRINGVVPGLAAADLHNKLYRQATIMAAALAQVIVEQGQDALDSDYKKLVASIKNSFVLSLNGEKPDEKGNISKNFVYSVEGKKPDSTGNVSLNIDYLNAMSFVGSVIITRDNINPGTKIGGTWQLLQSGKYIRTAGGDLIGGNTGGSDGFTLTVNNLPAHGHSATVYGAGEHKHAMAMRKRAEYGNGGYSDGAQPYRIYTETNVLPNIMQEAGNHTHQITINNTGNGEKVTFEPSYLLLYFWVRTA